MILYRSLLFIATTMNDDCNVVIALLDYSSVAMHDIIQCKASSPHIRTELEINEDLH